MYIKLRQYTYGLLHSKHMGSSRSFFRYFPHLNKCESIYIYFNFSFIVMNLKLKSLGLVMVGAPLGCREYSITRSKHDTGCKIERQKV